MNLYRIYSIIEFSGLKIKELKGECIFILNKKLKYYTKEMFKYFSILIVGFVIILIIIFMKYRPMYKVSLSGQELGYVENKEILIEEIEKKINETENLNIDNIEINIEPEYERLLTSKEEDTNYQEIVEIIKEDIEITYKYYNITVADETIETVNTIEEAEVLVNEIKADGTNIESLSIIEEFTKNKEDINVTEIEVAKEEIRETAVTVAEEKEEERIAQEKYDALPDINGIKLAATPLDGIVTSRYGEISSIRTSAHTGLDIAATQGTPIKAVSSGTIIYSGYSGAYGYLVKIDHGEGFQSWYAHSSQLYVSEGEYVNAGDIIAAVGSTGNSTGPHLHLELRINGQTVNPQAYIYK